MAIGLKDTSHYERTIDLDGSDGNAFVLLGMAQSVGKQIGHSDKMIESISEEMKAADYFHLVKVFDYYYGSVFDIVTTDMDLLHDIGANPYEGDTNGQDDID
jgi:hypothetical protein